LLHLEAVFREFLIKTERGVLYPIFWGLWRNLRFTGVFKREIIQTFKEFRLTELPGSFTIWAPEISTEISESFVATVA
jgi:hypothetical protein